MHEKEDNNNNGGLPGCVCVSDSDEFNKAYPANVDMLQHYCDQCWCMIMYPITLINLLDKIAPTNMRFVPVTTHPTG